MTRNRFRSLLRPLAVAALALAGFAVAGTAAGETRVLRLGSYATERPSEELRKLAPLQKDLQDNLARQGLDVRIEVRIFPTYEEGLLAIARGDVDFSRLGPASYVLAKQKAPGLKLLAVEAHDGDKTFDGVMFVRNDSPIRKISELRGKKYAFGDPSSTTGRYLPQAELFRNGIKAGDLARFDYLGRHDKVIFAVASGSHDAGSCNEKTFKKYAADKGVRELARFPSPTQAWAAKAQLDPALTRALKAALLAITGPGLEPIDRNGFLEASDADFDALRKAMKASAAFGD